jgi:hypothetical protein
MKSVSNFQTCRPSKSAALSLAVLALAVDDRKERESVTTSASPSAFLNEKRIRKMNGTDNKLRRRALTSGPCTTLRV